MHMVLGAALHSAARLGLVQVVEAFLTGKAPDLVPEFDAALTVAAASGHVAVVAALLADGRVDAAGNEFAGAGVKAGGIHDRSPERLVISQGIGGRAGNKMARHGL